MSTVWPVFTIGEIEFDELDDEVFLNDFDSFVLTNNIPCNNLPKCKLADNNNRPNNEFSSDSSKEKLLRNKGSSVIESPNADNFGGSLRPSPANGNGLIPEGMNSNAKRAARFHDQSSSEPPLKRPSCVKENCIPTSRNDQSNSLILTKNNTNQALTGSPKMLSEPKRLPNDSNLNKGFNFNADIGCRPMSNVSNGLRYTQNTASVVSSPSLTNGKTWNSGEASVPALDDQRRIPEINPISTNTPNRYTERDSPRNLLRNVMLPSVNIQTLEFRRFTKDPPDRLTATSGPVIQENSLYDNKRKTDAYPTPPITPNRNGLGNSAIDRFCNTISPSVNKQIPTLRGFGKDSLVPGKRRTPTAEINSVTPKTRRFPGPAGILPRLGSGQSLDNLPRPLAETPKKKSPELCHLVTDDSNEDFSIEPWTMMQDKIEKELLDCSDSLASVVRKAASRQLEKGKVAFLAVLVKSFHPTGLDVSIVLKDPSGEMRGTLHRKVVEQQQIELGPGCGLFLKQVSVFSPSPRKHYLNITPGNIIEIFPASAERCSSQTKISEATLRRGPKEKEKQSIHSDISGEIQHNESLNETNFDELLKEFDEEDDTMLIEAMNF